MARGSLLVIPLVWSAPKPEGLRVDYFRCWLALGFHGAEVCAELLRSFDSDAFRVSE